MNRNNITLKAMFFSLTLSLAIGAGAFSSYKKENINPTFATTHTENFDYYTYSGNYYDSITATGEGLNGTLRKALSSYILPASWPSYSGGGSDHLSTVLQYADEDPTNSSNMIYLYTRDSVTKNAASSWNREHVWPQSLSGGNWGTGKAGTDLLHLRPTYNTTNSTRGNDKYGEFTGGTARTYNGMPYGYSSGGYFMPLDSVKGDVARIIMYVWTAYKDYYSNLPDVTSTFQSYDTLMKWHYSDLPDVMEGHRNDYSLTSMQKNRNPFVDHPEYAWKIFGEKCSADVLAKAKEVYPDGGSPVIPAGITISDTAIQLTTGEHDSAQISAKSSNGSTITWTNSDSTIVGLSKTTSSSNSPITVSALKAGTATITASATIDDEVYSKKCDVIVTEEGEVTISTQYVELKVGETYEISAVSSDKSNISWKSSDSKIASFEYTMTPSGDTNTIIAKGEGQTLIWAVATIDGFEISQQCLVKVLPEEDPPVEMISLSKTNVVMFRNQRLVLTAYVQALTDEAVSWKATSPIVRISNAGLTRSKIYVNDIGEVDILASIKVEDTTYQAVCHITILENY